MPLVAGISSTRIRQLAQAGEVDGAARLLGRPLEVDGTVVCGDRAAARSASRRRTSLVEPDVLVPEFGIYAGAVGDKRAAISIGVNPHYGGTERRIEAYLLDWTGDLYGDRLVVELWRRLDGSGPSRARPTWSTRSPATSRRRGRRSARSV